VILVFDLDDTLFDELAYVHSGFRIVAKHIARTYHENYDVMFKRLCDVEKRMGRGKVFDVVLDEIGIHSQASVNKCLAVYRAHDPDICLWPEADDCLNRFIHLPLYVVTDGNKIAQKKKIKALGLVARIVHAYVTHQYGTRNAKPSPYCFSKICERERVAPNKVIYVADNPRKDFVGIKPLGFKTVRVLKGPYRAVKVTPSHEAHVTVPSLKNISQRLLDRLAHE
jgi:putative hydrolase of the HAD superfamily